MPSGWTRWLLEQFEFPFEVVYPKGLDAGNLANRFDVLIFVDGAFPAREAAAGAQPPPDRIPLEYRDHLGAVSNARTVPELKRFVEAGGTLIAIGSSTSLGRDFGLPIRSALVERAGRRRVASQRGQVLRPRIDTGSACRPVASARCSALAIASTSSSTTARPSACCRRQRSGASRLSPGSTVRLPSGADGPGVSSISIRPFRSSTRPLGKGRVVLVRPGDRVARAAARHVQVPVQRDLPGLRASGYGLQVGIGDQGSGIRDQGSRRGRARG